MTTDRRFTIGIALTFAATLLQLSSRTIGKVLISAQFTRGFCIGLSIMMFTVAVVLMVQAAYDTGCGKPELPADR